MANKVVPWDQRPEYLAYTDWTPIPGITLYPVPRKGTGTNVTQFHPGQAFLSEHNLPDIMYQLHPCAEWKRFGNSPLPEPKHNPDGTPVYEQYTRPGHQRRQLLDFKILPDKISTEEGWWYHEFVRRMDPRIRQRDIIMREEACEERLRMSDARYINIHLNTPGYRIYRPAWKMIAWHVTVGDERTNQRKQFVLDSLTDAQKQANTTRGSTPGLINPALGDIPGNRVDLPALGLKKRGPRGPKRAAIKANNNPAIEPAQHHQAPEAQQAPQVNQTHQASQFSQAPQADQDQQASQYSRASSPDVATAPSYVASATIGTPLQNIATTAAGPGENNVRGYASAQERDAAAMPPPPRPLQPRNNRSLQPQVSGSHSEPPDSTSQPPEFDGTEANSQEVEDVGATNGFVSEPEYPFLSDEEIAAMSAKSDKAMAEIYWLCEPFLGASTDLQGQPSMDLSAELIDDLGIGFMFPGQASGKVHEERNGNAMPNGVGTTKTRNVAQPVREKQGTKRKESHEDTGNFQDVQFDVEKQKRRAVKRLKSVHSTNPQNNSGELYQDAAYNFQQQSHFTPQVGNYQSGYIYGQTFVRPAMQGTRPLQHASVEDANPRTGGSSYEKQNGGMIGQYPNQIFKPYPPQHEPPASFTKTFPAHQQGTGSPYIAARAARDEIANQQSPSAPNAQYIGHQSTMGQPRPRVDRGNHRVSWGNTSENRRFHPYANPNRRTAQSTELDDMQPLNPLSDPTAQVDIEQIPGMSPASLEDASPSSRVPALPPNPQSGRFFIYRNNDPRQGLDVRATRRLLDGYLEGWS